VVEENLECCASAQLCKTAEAVLRQPIDNKPITYKTIRGFIMSDQVIRFYHIINLLPRHGVMTLTIPVLKNKLLDKGYDVSIRTLQRDMNALESIFFGIGSCKRTGHSNCWFWIDDAPINVSNLSLKHYCSQVSFDVVITQH